MRMPLQIEICNKVKQDRKDISKHKKELKEKVILFLIVLKLKKEIKTT
jgi:hypothetical protein